MSHALDTIRDLIQEDPCGRGLRADPASNLITACLDDFAAACRSIAETPNAALGIVTGFFIPTATPPAGETDGPLGALFLARALRPLGIRVAILTDGFCHSALTVGLAACGLSETVPLLILPGPACPWDTFLTRGWLPFVRERFGMTHLIALERVGPSHTLASLQAQPAGAAGESLLHFVAEVSESHQDRCHTMRGIDITEKMAPAHLLFEAVKAETPTVVTIGIGDGGNEIGMGKIRWDVIRRNVRGGGRVACRVPTDHLIVCGISNWGAYGLASGVRLLRGVPPGDVFDVERERELLALMVERGPLVDGMTGKPTATVDGLSWERYVEVLAECRLISDLR